MNPHQPLLTRLLLRPCREHHVAGMEFEEAADPRCPDCLDALVRHTATLGIFELEALLRKVASEELNGPPAAQEPPGADEQNETGGYYPENGEDE